MSVHPSRVAGMLASLLIVSPPIAGAVSLPVSIDGYFSEWTAGAEMATDPAGDGGVSGVDFTSLSLANDASWLYLRFDTTGEIQPDEGQDLVLGIDTDSNNATGQSMNGIGADLVWYLGQRTGTFYFGGSGNSIGHADIGLVVGPTVSHTEFEIAVDRNAVPLGLGPLFPGSDIEVVLADNDAGGDVLVLGSPGYVFDTGTQPVASLSLDRDAPEHIRIAGYNVQSDGLFSGGPRAAAIDRLLDAVDADVWVFCEVWNHDAQDLQTELEGYLPSGPGEAWNTVKRDNGNVIASRFPILNSWEIFPGNRLTAALLDLADSDLLVVANHWSCCTADDNRQDQADALIAFLADARTPGGVIDLTADTPIVLAGDFNLVGLRWQLETVQTGDILDNGTWGPDSPPDWDGSDLEDANPRHPDARFTYTWRRDTSTFYPGKLDWVFYTGSAMTLHNNYVLETRTMTTSSLSLYGLLGSDTETASDHAPVVADFTVGEVVGVGDVLAPEAGSRLLAAAPNPFGASTRIGFVLDERLPATLRILDLRGRVVRELLDGGDREAGAQEVFWDGRDANGGRVASGVYFYQLQTPGRSEARRLLLLH